MCRKMMTNYSTLGKVDTAILQQSVQNTRLSTACCVERNTEWLTMTFPNRGGGGGGVTIDKFTARQT